MFIRKGVENMKSRMAEMIVCFIAGIIVGFLLIKASSTGIPVIQAQTAGGAGNNAMLLGKIGGQDALIVLDSSTKTILIYRLLANTIEFWSARKFETDLTCEEFGTTRPKFDEVKRKCEKK